MTKNALIGILSFSGGRFFLNFLDEFFTQYNNKKIEQEGNENVSVFIQSVMDYNFNIVNIDAVLLKKNILNSIEKFDNSGISCLVIPNSILYNFYENICEVTKVPVFMTINEVVKYLKILRPQNLALVTSEKIIAKNLYQDQFDKNRLTYFHNETLQDMVNEGIISIKQSGMNSHIKRLIEKIYAYLFNNNCDFIVVDNQDLMRIFKQINPNYSLKIIDANWVLNESVFNIIVFNSANSPYKNAL